jgi:hypothetical protein
VLHRPVEWSGSPVSGGWVHGCPGDVAALTARGVGKPADMVETFDTDAGTIDVRVTAGTVDRGELEAARAELEAPAVSCCPPEAADLYRVPAGVHVHPRGDGFRDVLVSCDGCTVAPVTAGPYPTLAGAADVARRHAARGCAESAEAAARAAATEPHRSSSPAPRVETLTLF